MTDRELLELAAKACGYTIRENGTDVNGETWYWCEQIADCWNPLNDDGDALRLAVECLGFYTLQYSAEDWEHCKHDGHAATRRAIVRAAAEIGKRL